jgi:hypothetical protein
VKMAACGLLPQCANLERNAPFIAGDRNNILIFRPSLPLERK